MAAGGAPSYVLSTYLSPPGARAFTVLRHDQAVALWRVGERAITLVRYWQLERLSGMKHHELPLYDDEHRLGELIEGLLAREGLTPACVDEIWGTPGLGRRVLPPASQGRGLPIHTLAHLFSSLCMDMSRFRDSTIIALAMDGGPDYTIDDEIVDDNWYAGAISRNGDLAIVPVESPGVLWGAASLRFGREPGTLMALATASPARIEWDLEPLLARRYDGGMLLLPAARKLVEAMIEEANRALAAGPAVDGFTQDELVASAVMKVIQRASIAIVRRNVDALLESAGVAPGEAYLALSGGYALNCPTNSLLLDDYGFRGLLAPPCADDSGQALGIGLLGFFNRGDLDTRKVELGLPFMGGTELAVAVAARRWRPGILDVREFDEATFVGDLETQPVAWVDGAAEVGPRALGHRSLLGDPRSPATKTVMNEVKQRQWWRPVAPIVLEEAVRDWFVGGRPSRFMLETFQVPPERRGRVPAILHLDGSARIQTLSAEDEPFLYRAMQAFAGATGVPIICNTSLNDRGEPLVDDASQALNFCFRKGIRVAYIERRRYLLDAEWGASAADGPEARPLYDWYAHQNPRPVEVYGEAVDPEVMFLLYYWPPTRRLVTTARGQVRLRSIARLVAQRDERFQARSQGFVDYWRRVLEKQVPQGQGELQ